MRPVFPVIVMLALAGCAEDGSPLGSANGPGDRQIPTAGVYQEADVKLLRAGADLHFTISEDIDFDQYGRPITEDYELKRGVRYCQSALDPEDLAQQVRDTPIGDHI